MSCSVTLVYPGFKTKSIRGKIGKGNFKLVVLSFICEKQKEHVTLTIGGGKGVTISPRSIDGNYRFKFSVTEDTR